MNIKCTLIEAHIFRRIEDGIEFLLMKRAPNEIYAGVWQMVTGAIEKDEKAFETAIREIKEETNLFPKGFWIVPNVNSFYSSVDDSITMLPVFVAEVEKNSDVILSSEHTEFIWCSKNKAKEMLAWPGQRKSVDIISEYFSENNSLLKLIEIEIIK
jgi:dATP pyrophosphohydrolase